EDGIRDPLVTGVQTCALPISTALYLEKRYAEAVRMFETESREAGAPALTFFVLASCYDHLHLVPEALAAYEKFLDLSNGKNPTRSEERRVGKERKSDEERAHE